MSYKMKSHCGLRGQGEMSVWQIWVPSEFLQSVLPATGLQGTLACLNMFPAGWPVVQEPGRTCRGPQAKCQALGPVHSPQSPGKAPAHLFQVLGVKRSLQPGVESFASGAAGRAEESLLVEVAGHTG